MNDSIIAINPIRFSSKNLLNLLGNKDWYTTSIQEKKSETRKQEWLSIRLLLKEILGEEKEIVYRESGKPVLKDQSYNLSISHTKGYIAIILNKKKSVGIDIERISNRVYNIRSRFLNEKEEINISTQNELTHLLLHWSAKETLFKVLDENEVDFKTQLHIHPFEPIINKWAQFTASETKTEKEETFVIDYLVTKEYVVTLTIKN